VLFRLDLRPNLGVCFPSNQSPLCDQLAGSGTSSWGSAPFALFILHVAQMLYYVLTCNMNIHFALCGRIGWGKDLGYRCFARLPRGAWWGSAGCWCCPAARICILISAVSAAVDKQQERNEGQDQIACLRTRESCTVSPADCCLVLQFKSDFQVQCSDIPGLNWQDIFVLAYLSSIHPSNHPSIHPTPRTWWCIGKPFWTLITPLGGGWLVGFFKFAALLFAAEWNQMKWNVDAYPFFGYPCYPCIAAVCAHVNCINVRINFRRQNLKFRFSTRLVNNLCKQTELSQAHWKSGQKCPLALFCWLIHPYSHFPFFRMVLEIM